LITGDDRDDEEGSFILGQQCLRQLLRPFQGERLVRIAEELSRAQVGIAGVLRPTSLPERGSLVSGGERRESDATPQHGWSRGAPAGALPTFETITLEGRGDLSTVFGESTSSATFSFWSPTRSEDGAPMPEPRWTRPCSPHSPQAQYCGGIDVAERSRVSDGAEVRCCPRTVEWPRACG
jgi:hypothetical protein